MEEITRESNPIEFLKLKCANKLPARAFMDLFVSDYIHLKAISKEKVDDEKKTTA